MGIEEAPAAKKAIPTNIPRVSFANAVNKRRKKDNKNNLKLK